MIKRLITRFRQMMHTYIGDNIPIFKIIFFVVDYLCAFVFYGASISDYFAYGFYNLRRSGRNEYITYRRYHKIQNICNPLPENREICRNKVKFNKRFKDFLGRDWIDVSEVSYQEFKSFVLKHDVIFLKEVSGYRGIGTTKYISSDIADIRSLFDSVKADSGAKYVFEEQIVQHNELSAFHPWSVNTIRIVTVYNNTTNEVHFINARFRMGNKKNHVDNFHFDGIGANINIQTGIIDTVGYDVHNTTYIHHPETGKQIIGFQIPHWEECKKYVEQAAKSLPEVRYIGWDVVIKNDGTFILIEANDNADHDFQQLHNKGLWKEYKQILKQII